MEENRNWATPSIKERPFWRDGMSCEEYELERAYYYNYLNKDIAHQREYKPLWKQNKEFACDMSDSIFIMNFALEVMEMTEDELYKHIREKE